MNYTDDDWADKVLESIVPVVAPECYVLRPGSLWVSKSTGRRATCLWASGEQACLSFSEHSRHTLMIQEVLRLYTPV